MHDAAVISGSLVDAKNERWRPISGYPYEVSNLGRVKSINRCVKITRNGRVHISHKSGRVLKAGLDTSGYRQVYLNGTKMFRVCVLVTRAFHGPRPAGHQACHKDGNRQNDDAANLMWGTAKENAADRKRHGTERLGEQRPNSKLTSDQVEDIRKNRGKIPQHQLAAIHGVSRNTVKNIQLGRTWRHV